MDIVGYSDRLTVRAGDRVSFMVSSAQETYEVETVRLIHGDENPLGPGFKAEPIASDVSGQYRGRVQEIKRGSYIRAQSPGGLEHGGSLTAQFWLRPTLPKQGTQTILDCGTFALRIADGRLELDSGKRRVQSVNPVSENAWHFVIAAYDHQDGHASIAVERLDRKTYKDLDLQSGPFEWSEAPARTEWLIGAEMVGGVTRNHFNGKIEAPRLFSRTLESRELAALKDGADPTQIAGLIAAWDFSQDIASRHVQDISGNSRHGRTVNMPMRGAVGHNWDGSEIEWKRAPHQYGAIHFHDDDLDDAEWDVDFAWDVPADLPSGVYAAHLQTPTAEDYVPFVVRPHPARPTARILFLLPTFSYLAYGNEQICETPETRQILKTLGVDGELAQSYPSQPQDKYIVANRLLSLYDRHSDGSGVCYSSRLRPILNMRPKYHMVALDRGSGSPHQFCADLCVVDWLTHQGYEFDMATDEDLQREGAELVRPYDVVLTGTHCEYYSHQQIDALQSYLDDGGRLMYLGGNGFYWVTQLDEEGHTIEIRRVGPSTRAWETEPGEACLSVSGEFGGLWRYRDRAPQSWLGVGFTAEGVGPGRPYERQDGSRDPRAAFVFAGLDDDLIGDNPSLVNGYGAAGFELDRFDRTLGSPADSIVLASASGFSDFYQHVSEEILISNSLQGGTVNPFVRADMVLVPYPNDGAVFSTGSIAWAGSLSVNNYENTVSRVTKNVLDRFLVGGVPSEPDSSERREADQ